MALTKRSETGVIYLQAKHYCLWQEIKKHVDGCDVVETKNPKTGDSVTKYGYRYNSVSGRATKLFWYDTKNTYAQRYFGFKLQISDGPDTYVLDMPYQGQMLRRFLRTARSIDWRKPLSITVFKGKKQSGDEETGIWFQQGGETVKSYYTREQPRGMPPAVQDPITEQWDFKAQQRWLAEKLKEETIPDIEAAAAIVAPPMEPELDGNPEHHSYADDSGPAPTWHKDEIDDSDVPF